MAQAVASSLNPLEMEAIDIITDTPHATRKILPDVAIRGCGYINCVQKG